MPGLASITLFAAPGFKTASLKGILNMHTKNPSRVYCMYGYWVFLVFGRHAPVMDLPMPLEEPVITITLSFSLNPDTPPE